MNDFTITSPEFKDQERLQLVHEFDGYDGTGRNRSPALQWQGAPEGTKSFALTLYDPDAPTGSGFWHWILFDIDSSVTQLAAGRGSSDGTDLGASGTQAANDYGAVGYGGPCPPKGLPAHRYIFTVFAVDTDRLDVTPENSGAIFGFNLHFHTLARASITGVYENRG